MSDRPEIKGTTIPFTEEQLERMTHAYELKMEFDREYRRRDHEEWTKLKTVEIEAATMNRFANKLISVINVFHWMLLLLILYKFWGLS